MYNQYSNEINQLRAHASDIEAQYIAEVQRISKIQQDKERQDSQIKDQQQQ